jgi:hypothetical protein
VVEDNNYGNGVSAICQGALDVRPLPAREISRVRAAMFGQKPSVCSLFIQWSQPGARTGDLLIANAGAAGHAVQVPIASIHDRRIAK